MATKNKVTYARKWRKDRRENRRLEIFTIQYLQCKYSAIYTEIQQKFEEINAKYPNKNNLTKTPEFLVWKSDVALSQQPDVNTQEPVATQRTVPSVNTTTSAPQEPVATQRTVPSVNTTTSTPEESPSQEQSTTATTTTVVNTSQELPQLYDEQLYGDPWMLDLDTSEMARIIEDLSKDPDLQGIMDTFNA